MVSSGILWGGGLSRALSRRSGPIANAQAGSARQARPGPGLAGRGPAGQAWAGETGRARGPSGEVGPGKF
eukprot:341263-Pyramimonas_sp.AAC.1